MLNAFKYVIANDGVDCEQDYSFAGKVRCTTHILLSCKSSVHSVKTLHLTSDNVLFIRRFKKKNMFVVAAIFLQL